MRGGERGRVRALRMPSFVPTSQRGPGRVNDFLHRRASVMSTPPPAMSVFVPLTPRCGATASRGRWSSTSLIRETWHSRHSTTMDSSVKAPRH